MNHFQNVTSSWEMYKLKVFTGPFFISNARHAAPQMQGPKGITSATPTEEHKRVYTQRNCIADAHLNEDDNIIFPKLYLANTSPSAQALSPNTSLWNVLVNRKQRDLIALQFANINIANLLEIQTFCNLYGVPYGDYEIYRPASEKPYFKTFKPAISVHDFVNEVVFLHNLVNLGKQYELSSLKISFKSVFESIVFFLFIANLDNCRKSLEADPSTHCIVMISECFKAYCAHLRTSNNVTFPIECDNTAIISDFLSSSSLWVEELYPDCSSVHGAKANRLCKEKLQLLEYLFKWQNQKNGKPLSISYSYENKQVLINRLHVPQDLKDPLYTFGKELLCGIINSAIKHIPVQLSIDGGKITQQMIPLHLLDVMYLELFMVLTNSESFMRCERCQKLYSSFNRRSDTMFCSTKCKNSIASKRYRDKKKAESLEQ